MAYRVALAAPLVAGITFSLQSYYASPIGTATYLLTPTFAALAGLSAALALSKYT